MITALLATLSIASQADTGKHVFFTGDAGLVNASGNSEFTSLNVGDKFTVLAGAWKFGQTFSVTYARTHDSVTAEQWQGSVRGDRTIRDRIGLFLLTDVSRNTFAGVRSRVAPSFGITAVALQGARDTLRLEAGGGYTIQSAVRPDTDRNFPSGRVAAIYHHKIGAKAAFDETFEYIPNFSVGADYRINSESSLTAPITTGVALKASYVVHYEGLPESGFKRTDRILSTGIQVTF